MAQTMLRRSDPLATCRGTGCCGDPAAEHLRAGRQRPGGLTAALGHRREGLGDSGQHTCCVVCALWDVAQVADGQQFACATVATMHQLLMRAAACMCGCAIACAVGEVADVRAARVLWGKWRTCVLRVCFVAVGLRSWFLGSFCRHCLGV